MIGEQFVAKRSGIEGVGIYATAPFKKGEVICQMKGEYLTISELKRRYRFGKERVCDPLQISERQYIDLRKPYVFFNHSCVPNAGIRGKSLLVAIKNIKQGEEITYDYSTTEWTYDKFGRYKGWAMECNCRSRSCRGVIEQFPNLSTGIQNKYLKAGALQDFILRKMEENGSAKDSSGKINITRRRIHGYTAPETEVRRSAIDKLGLFAKTTLPQGKVVAGWGGRILTQKEILKLPAKFKTNYALPLYPGFYIAESGNNDLDSADFINHSCEPNCRIVNLLIMITKRRIRSGEELTANFNHGPKYGRKTKCHCGAVKCRGVVYF